MDFTPPPNGRRTAHEYVRDTLRHGILAGHTPPGSHLVQAELAYEFRVSTTPVREALRDLASEGLIHLDAHRGAVVRTLTEAELNEIYDVRRLLEPEVIRRATERITPAELARADRILAAAEEEADPATWVELNRQFHAVFTEAARSPRLATIMHGLQNSATMYIVASLRLGRHRRERANRQHRELLAAVRCGEAERAAALALTHAEQSVRTSRTIVQADRG